MKLFSILLSLTMMVAYLMCLITNTEARRNSDIIIMGKDGWGSGMGNLIKTGGRRGGDTILLSGNGCGWW